MLSSYHVRPFTEAKKYLMAAMNWPGCRVYEAKEYLLHAQNALLVSLLNANRGFPRMVEVRVTEGSAGGPGPNPGGGVHQPAEVESNRKIRWATAGAPLGSSPIVVPRNSWPMQGHSFWHTRQRTT